MEAKTEGREYVDFEPNTSWVREDTFDTLLIVLPAFKKEQLRVQITSAGKLRVTGERQVGGNKWSRFRKEMPIPANYDSSKISAKFDNGTLHVKFPKTTVQAEPHGEVKPEVQPTKPPEPTPTAQPQETGQKQDTKEVPKAEKVPAKPTEEEKKPKKSIGDEEKPKEVKEESKKADEAKKGPQTAIQQKSSEGLVEKDQKLGDTADIGKKMEKPDAGDIGKPKPKNHKENVGSFITKLKNPRNLINTVVAALLIVVLGLYVKHALRSFGLTQSDPEL